MLINSLYFNQAIAILISFYELDTSPISQNKNAYSQAITALTFLSAPKSGATLNEYLCCFDKARNIHMKKTIGEAAEKCGTMEKNNSSIVQLTHLKTHLPVL